MENRKATEAGQDVTMQKEDFAVLWKTIHLKVTDTYEVPPEILWVNGSTIGTLGNFSASTGKAKSKKTFNISAIVAAALKNDEVLKYSAYCHRTNGKSSMSIQSRVNTIATRSWSVFYDLSDCLPTRTETILFSSC